MPELTDEQSKERFVDLMVGPDAAKVWRQRSITLGAENDRLVAGIRELQRVWFSGVDLDKDKISQACLTLFRLLPTNGDSDAT